MSVPLVKKIERRCERLAVRFEVPVDDGIARDSSGRLYDVFMVTYRIVACPVCGALGDAFDFRGVMLAGVNRGDSFFYSQFTCPTRPCGGYSSNYRMVPRPSAVVYVHRRGQR